MSSAFNTQGQNITFIEADGVTNYTMPLSEIDHWIIYDTRSAIVLASQVGACFVMFFVLIILSKPNKRRTPIFALNLLSLLFGFFRNLFPTFYYTSSYIKTFNAFVPDLSQIQVPAGAAATSVVSSIVPIFMVITVNASLALQAHTVSKNMSDVWRWAITGFSWIMGLLAVGFKFAEVITNAETILSVGNYFSKLYIQQGALITQTIVIWYFCLIFTGKLFYTLYIRRRNGWKQWSGVRILAAMGGCTMAIPSLFTILEYVKSDKFPQAGTLSLTMVALLLPFSSLWAGIAIQEESSTLNFSKLNGSQEAVRRGSENSSFNACKTCNTQLSESTYQSTSYGGFKTERKGNSSAPMGMDSRIEHVPGQDRRDSTEVDLEAMGVRVDHTYGVHRGED